jgi:hypothetical protein
MHVNVALFVPNLASLLTALQTSKGLSDYSDPRKQLNK